MMNTMVQKTQLNSITHSFFFPCSVSKDRFVEWMMRDFRMWLGKTGNAHTGTLLERCAVMLGQLKRDKNIARTFLHADSANAREKEDAKLYVNAIFCEVFVFAMEANLFGDGPPMHCKKRASSRQKGADGATRASNYEEFTSGSDFSCICLGSDKKQVKLNKELLRVLNIGERRVMDYYDTYMVHGDLDDPSRSEGPDGVSLKSVKPLKRDIENDIKSKIERTTSTKLGDIGKFYTKAELDDEIYYLNSVLLELDPCANPQRKGKLKDESQSKVFLLCLQIIELDETWVERRTAEVKEEILREMSGYEDSVEDIAAAEINNPFFSFTHHTTTKKGTRMFTFKRAKYGSADNDCPDLEIHDGDEPSLVDENDQNDEYTDERSSGRYRAMSRIMRKRRQQRNR